jgi:acyl dehydratase
MNYAAGIGDESPFYYDTSAPDGVQVHPGYLSQLEWRAIDALLDDLPELSAEERDRGLHSFNETVLDRPVRDGDRLCSIAEVVGLEPSRRGARMTFRVRITDLRGAVVGSSLSSVVYREVPYDALGVRPPACHAFPRLREWVPGPDARTSRVRVSAIAAHVFSECARDYGAIHTDIAVARRAGLPALILHGTAVLSLALSDIVANEAGGVPDAVAGFRVALRAMVPCPSDLDLLVEADPTNPALVRFEARTADGGRALDSGAALLRAPGPGM